LDAGFEYGLTAADLLDSFECDPPAGASGNFSVTLNSLSFGTTYYYRAYITTSAGTTYGSVKSFTTSSPSTATGDSDADTFARSMLANYEMPATTVTLQKGTPYHSTANETYGSTKAYIFNPASTSQIVVTHTFSYGGKTLRNYSMLFDKNKRCALWTAFVMHATEYKDNSVGRNQAWDYDPAITKSWQPDLSSSYDGDYDRGHQVASNERQTTVEQNKQTFYYSNMTPQFGTLNQGQWGALETKVQTAAKSITGRDSLYVVTGPIFGSSPSTTKDASNVACPIPSGYFKCLMKCSFDTNGQMTAAVGCAYYFGTNSSNETWTLKTIDEIESMTGFDFYANVPSTYQTDAESQKHSFFTN